MEPLPEWSAEAVSTRWRSPPASRPGHRRHGLKIRVSGARAPHAGGVRENLAQEGSSGGSRARRRLRGRTDEAPRRSTSSASLEFPSSADGALSTSDRLGLHPFARTAASRSAGTGTLPLAQSLWNLRTKWTRLLEPLFERFLTPTDLDADIYVDLWSAGRESSVRPAEVRRRTGADHYFNSMKARAVIRTSAASSCALAE